MKKLLCICMIMMSCISAFGQASVSNVAIPEPEFNGDAFICNLSANTYVYNPQNEMLPFHKTKCSETQNEASSL